VNTKKIIRTRVFIRDFELNQLKELLISTTILLLICQGKHGFIRNKAESYSVFIGESFECSPDFPEDSELVDRRRPTRLRRPSRSPFNSASADFVARMYFRSHSRTPRRFLKAEQVNRVHGLDSVRSRMEVARALPASS